MGIEPVCIAETPYEIVQQFTITVNLNKAGRVKALLDSGAAGNFINQNTVKELKLKTIPRNGSLQVTHVKGGKVRIVDRQVKCYMRIRCNDSRIFLLFFPILLVPNSPSFIVT